MFISKTGKALWKLLGSEDGWSADRFRLRHEPTKTALWIANGGLFFNGDDDWGSSQSQPQLGLIERHIIWCRASRLIDRLGAAKLAS